jgi:hypothetical protein
VGRLARIAALLGASTVVASAATFVEGRVWERAGDERRPVAKARLILTPSGERGPYSFVRSDAEGRWRLPLPGPGRARIGLQHVNYFVVSADGAASDSVFVDCTVTCGPIDFEVARRPVVYGVVVDDQGEPVSSAQVFLSRLEESGETRDGRFGPEVQAMGERTDDRGRFRLLAMLPGEFRASARRMGYPDSEEYDSTEVPVRLEAGVETEVRLTLRRRSTRVFRVAGRVSGVPIGEGERHAAEMRPAREEIGFGPGRRMAALDGEGRFVMEGVAPGRYWFLHMRMSERGAPDQTPLGDIEVSADIDGLVLSPRPTVRVAGRFEFDGARPPGRLHAYLVSKDSAPTAPILGLPPDFRFEQDGFVPGLYAVASQSGEWFLKEVRRGDRSLDPEAISIGADIDDLVVVLSDIYGSVEGRVRSATGEVRRYRVDLSRTGGRSRIPGQTDQLGVFRFQQMAPGEYSVCVRLADAPESSPCALERAFPIEAGAAVELELTVR